MTAAPAVPNRHAKGTSRFGFSTAAEFCAADSSPRNAQSVSAILDPIPSPQLMPFGFHAAANVAGSNHTQPITEISPTGRMMPQTVMAPIRPVSAGPPKLAIVVSQSRPIAARQVASGVDDNEGMNAERYPTPEIATATFAIAIDRKYKKNTWKYPDLPYP